jgi:hypothetical protein
LVQRLAVLADPRVEGSRCAQRFFLSAARTEGVYACAPGVRYSYDERGGLSDSPRRPIAEPHDRAGARSALVWAESYRCIASGGEVA